ncbi:condensation domain-containing protein, partial [Pedobacter psychrotolerans]|uniref:condensation domain-containing protein n=1 Tax=Pedobacter psychrotolerans TaxID=1843235 RepID=UPI0027E55CB8
MVSPLRIQYKDYAAWQQAQLSGEFLQAHKSYWLEQFSGELPVLSLPADHPRPALKTYNGSIVYGSLESGQLEELGNYCQSQGATLFMGLLGLLNVLFYRYTGQEDMVIGSPIAGREQVELEDQIGFYVNTLALRTRFHGTGSYSELLKEVRELTLSAYDHQVYPFDELVEALQLQRDMSRNPLFDVMMVLQNTDVYTLHKDPAVLKVRSYQQRATSIGSKFDLQFTFFESGDGLDLQLEYNTDLYERATMDRMLGHFQSLVSAVLAAPDMRLSDLEYLSGAERNQ